ncbi:hypothetical protein BD560DRAFT_477233, partial [Blakeslea trispora]
NEEQFRLKALNFHSQHLAQLTQKSEKEIEAVNSCSDVYKTDSDSIFEKRRKTGRLRMLHEEHKNVILEFIDSNPSVVLFGIMKKLKQIFTESKVLNIVLFRFVKQYCTSSLRKEKKLGSQMTSQSSSSVPISYFVLWMCIVTC